MPPPRRPEAVPLSSRPWRRAMLPIGVLALALAAGCARTVGPTMEDASLAFAVRTVLVNDPQLGTAPIEVLVSGRRVILTGTVASAEARDRALALAGGVQGVSRVEDRLAVGTAGGGPPATPALSALPPPEAVRPGRHVGVGGSFQAARTRSANLSGHWSLAPSFRFGRGGGLRPAFDWFRLGTDLGSGEGEKFGSVRFTVLAGGLGYGVATENWSFVGSVTTGYAFTGFDIKPDFPVPPGRAVPVEASGSWAVLPTATLWFDAPRHVSVGITGGYMFVWPHITWLEDDRFVRRPIDAKTFVIGVSIVYWVF